MLRPSKPIQILLSCIGIMIAGLLAALSHKILDEGPLIASDSGIDLGNYPKGADIHHRFNIWNLSGQRVYIEKVATSCTCTVASLNQTSIAPFSCASAILTIDTSRQGLGHRMRGVTVTMKDGRNVSEMVYFTSH